MIKLTGFTDEVSNDLDVQVKITRELGWEFISARTIGEKNIHDISKDEFEKAVSILNDHNIRVAEFGTLIGNWGKSIHSDWDLTLGEIKRCIPRMQRLGVRYARIMSYAQLPWGDDQYEEVRFERLREIVNRFKDAGLQALHENCMNWGGFSADHTLRLLDEVPDLKLVFDTGNPIFQRDRSKPQPYPWQDPLEFYKKVRHAVDHIHIKDAVMKKEEGEPEYTFPGEGNGHIKEILTDLVSAGYNGFIAIEPHMGKVFHLADQSVDADYQYKVYFEYGKRIEKMIQQIQSEPA